MGELQEGGRIEIDDIDEYRDTWISIGCYRETHRLERVLRVYRKALTLARAEGLDGALCASLRALHDHKGLLTVRWAGPSIDVRLQAFVDAAWADECEILTKHEIERH